MESASWTALLVPTSMCDQEAPMCNYNGNITNNTNGCSWEETEAGWPQVQREFFIDNLLVRIH